MSNRQMSKHGTVHARGEMLGREDTASGDGDDGIGMDDSSLNCPGKVNPGREVGIDEIN